MEKSLKSHSQPRRITTTGKDKRQRIHDDTAKQLHLSWKTRSKKGKKKANLHCFKQHRLLNTQIN